MNTNAIALLRAYQKNIEDSFNKIDKILEIYKNNEKKSSMSSLKQDLANIKTNIALMNEILVNLRVSKSLWTKLISQLKSKFELYKQNIIKLEQNKNCTKVSSEFIKRINAKVEYFELKNVQQVIKRGEKLLNEDDKTIKNMANVVHQGVNHMKDINIELNNQQEKLENVESDIKDIDYSLKRAGKQITNIFKMYFSDKCITCMIIAIIIIIITIIILYCFGDDKNNHFNIPYDIFNSNNN